MCQNLQRLQSSEENLVHICISKKLLLWLLHTLCRNLCTRLWYFCGFDYHTCHTMGPPNSYEDSQADSLAGWELWRAPRNRFFALPQSLYFLKISLLCCYTAIKFPLKLFLLHNAELFYLHNFPVYFRRKDVIIDWRTCARTRISRGHGGERGAGRVVRVNGS